MVVVNEKFNQFVAICASLLGAVIFIITILRVFIQFSGNASTTYEIVQLPVAAGTNNPPRFCVVHRNFTTCSNGGRCYLSPVYNESSENICLAADGTNRRVYASVGTFTRVFVRYDLSCSSTPACVTISDCQSIFQTYIQALTNGSAFNTAGNYTIKKGNGWDTNIWGSICGISQHKIAYLLLILVIAVLSIHPYFQQRKHAKLPYLWDRTVEDIEETWMWTIFGAYHTHILHNWTVGMIGDAFFAFSVAFFYGEIYSVFATWVIYFTVIGAILGSFTRAWWVRTMLNEIQADSHFNTSDYSFGWAVWFCYIASAILQLLIVLFSFISLAIERSVWTSFIFPSIKILMVFVAFHGTYCTRPFWSKLDRLDGEANVHNITKSGRRSRPNKVVYFRTRATYHPTSAADNGSKTNKISVANDEDKPSSPKIASAEV